MTGDDTVAQASRSIGYNVALQMAMRLVTFLLNAFIIRYVDRSALGIINVRLMLLFSTTQFLSRESFRRSALSDARGRSWPQVVNVIWMSVPLSLGLGSLLGLIWANYLEAPDEPLVADYRTAIVMVVLSAIIQNLSESLFIFGQLNGYIKLKVVVEGVELLVRVILMALLIAMFPHRSIALFGYALLTSSIVYSLWYHLFFYLDLEHRKSNSEMLTRLSHPVKSIREFFPSFRRPATTTSPLDTDLTHLSITFLKQSFLKQFLTEGERYVMTIFSSITFVEQGIFDVVNNLGGMAARLIFAPIEESSYMLFAEYIDRTKTAEQQSPRSRKEASNVLRNALKLMTLIGLTIFVFGHHFAHLALKLYGGQRLANYLGTKLLRANCVYVPFIALNGITEAFTFAAMSKRDLESFNKKMIAISVVFLLSSVYLSSRLGSVGFIWSNCVNMSLRIVHSLLFIRKFFGHDDPKEANSSGPPPLGGLLPDYWILGHFAVTYLVLALSASRLCCTDLIPTLVHLALGAVLLIVLIILVYWRETDMRQFILVHILRRRAAGDEDTDKTPADADQESDKKNE